MFPGFVGNGLYQDAICSASARAAVSYISTSQCQVHGAQQSSKMSCSSGAPVQQMWANSACSGTPVSSNPLSTSCTASSSSPNQFNKYECAAALPSNYMMSMSYFSSPTCTGAPFMVMVQGTSNCAAPSGAPSGIYAACVLSGMNLTTSMYVNALY